jgi:hypothetical protein
MQLLGYNIEIWAVAILATITRLRATEGLTVQSAFSISIISIASSLLLYESVMIFFGLPSKWELFIVTLVALTFEDLMRNIMTLTKDNSFLKDIIKIILQRK